MSLRRYCDRCEELLSTATMYAPALAKIHFNTSEAQSYAGADRADIEMELCKGCASKVLQIMQFDG